MDGQAQVYENTDATEFFMSKDERHEKDIRAAEDNEYQSVVEALNKSQAVIEFDMDGTWEEIRLQRWQFRPLRD